LGAGAGAAMAFTPNPEWEKELSDKDMECMDHEIRIKATNFKKTLALNQTHNFVRNYLF
jgi:hypothetical protein